MPEIQPKNIPIAWELQGFPQYGFGTDKKLYNVRRGRAVRKVVKGYTAGFNLAGKFYSLNQIRPLLRKPAEIECPF
jgi:hypothetical protein